VDLLEKARALGDMLIVGLNTDASVKRLKGEGRPVNPELDRARVLGALGAVGPDGGPVTLYNAGGRPVFVGTSRNGVSTGRWGPYTQTFVFASPAPACATQTAGPVNACPRTLAAFRGMPPGQPLRCRCSPAQYGGSIWGTDRYTTDSSVCGAALHAGAIPATGGVVTLRTAGGCPRFNGSSRNGINTRRWGSYNRTFYFGPQAPACQ